ncbi:MAG: hypothetical protein HKN28_08680 [Alphaproteobacteria bacterium]|nr:hypothetical protein [Alphaproteobacteria bacterium]
MSLGLSESRNRRRRQGRMIIILLRWLFVIAVAIGAGYYAWDFGTELARKEVRVLQTELAQATAESTQLRTDITGLETALREERGLVAQWRDRYEAEVPTAEDAALLRAIQDRVGNGVSRERLAEVIRLAQERDVCEPLPETRRFVVQNPVYSGANDTVSIADAAIIVTAIGESQINAGGRPEAWFDPAKPVTVYFTRPGGETTSTVGVLPLHHAVVVGDREFRFSIIAGNRSFAEIAGRTCVYP